MPYSTALPGVREAALDAIRNALIAKITDLQNALSTISPAIQISVPVTSAQFHIGDFDSIPDASVQPWWVNIEGGGQNDGTDATHETQATGGIYKTTFCSNIYFYVHPDAFAGMSTIAQAEQRSRLRSRFADWLIYDIANTFANQALTLGSQQYSPGTADVIQRCHVSQVTCGWVQKGGAQTVWLFMAHFKHESEIYGPA